MGEVILQVIHHSPKWTANFYGPVWLSLLWSSLLFAHCHNIHGIAPHGARHVIETAAYAHISLSAVVKRGSLETRTLVKVIWLWNTNLSYSETLLHSESEKVFSESKCLTN